MHNEQRVARVVGPDDGATESAPASPCVGLCRLDRHETCQGCGRTLDEIARWSRMSATEQWSVVGRLARRTVLP